jgi:hypothetical protein
LIKTEKIIEKEKEKIISNIHKVKTKEKKFISNKEDKEIEKVIEKDNENEKLKIDENNKVEIIKVNKEPEEKEIENKENISKEITIIKNEPNTEIVTENISTKKPISTTTKTITTVTTTITTKELPEEERRIKKITLLTNIINKNTSIGRYFIKWWKLLPDEIEEIVEVNGVKTKTYKKRKINVKRTVKNVETIEEKKISNIANINKPEEDKDITTKYTNMKIEKEESSNIDKSNIVDKEKEIIDKEKEDKTKIYEKESEKEKLKDSKELSNKEDKEIEKVIEKDNENEKVKIDEHNKLQTYNFNLTETF